MSEASTSVQTHMASTSLPLPPPNPNPINVMFKLEQSGSNDGSVLQLVPPNTSNHSSGQTLPSAPSTPTQPSLPIPTPSFPSNTASAPATSAPAPNGPLSLPPSSSVSSIMLPTPISPVSHANQLALPLQSPLYVNQANQGAKRKRTSHVWTSFSHGAHGILCTHCGQVFSTKSSTTTLMNHLRKTHMAENVSLSVSTDSATIDGNSSALENGSMGNNVALQHASLGPLVTPPSSSLALHDDDDTADAEKYLIKFIARNQILASIFDDPDFRMFVETLREGYHLPSSVQILQRLQSPLRPEDSHRNLS